MLFQELPLAGDVAAVTFGEYVLAQGVYRFPGDDLAADSALDGDFELLPGDFVPQALADFAGAVIGVAPENQLGKGVHRLAVQ